MLYWGNFSPSPIYESWENNTASQRAGRQQISEQQNREIELDPLFVAAATFARMSCCVVVQGEL